MNIELHIERLILDGLAIEPGQAADIQTALEGELTRLLVESGVRADLRAGGAMPSLRGRAINVTSETNAAQLGTQIAQSVHGGIGQIRMGGSR